MRPMVMNIYDGQLLSIDCKNLTICSMCGNYTYIYGNLPADIITNARKPVPFKIYRYPFNLISIYFAEFIDIKHYGQWLYIPKEDTLIYFLDKKLQPIKDRKLEFMLDNRHFSCFKTTSGLVLLNDGGEIEPCEKIINSGNDTFETNSFIITQINKIWTFRAKPACRTKPAI